VSSKDSPGGLAGAPLPVSVALDGTLIRTSTLFESLVRLVTRRPWLVLMPLVWILGGKAKLRAELARRVTLNPALLPYDERVLKYLAGEKSRGRKLVLTGACAGSSADAVAAHLGLFDEVAAPAGNSPSDELFPRQGSALAALVRALRPYQWSKNLLVFVPIITSNHLFDYTAWLSAFWAAAAFSATASGLYVLNDLADLDADRAHPRKRNRPFASGAAPLWAGLVLAPALLVAGIAVAAAVHVLPIMLLYAAVSMAYSFGLKQEPLVDVFALAFLYIVRLYAGGLATGHYVSMWLLAFSAFLFLALALAKRTTELADAEKAGRKVERRGYAPGDLPVLRTMGIASTFVSSMVLALYVQSPEIAARYASPIALWALVPLMLFWQARMWLAAGRGWMHDDPIVHAARDWVTWLVVTLILVTIMAAARL